MKLHNEMKNNRVCVTLYKDIYGGKWKPGTYTLVLNSSLLPVTICSLRHFEDTVLIKNCIDKYINEIPEIDEGAVQVILSEAYHYDDYINKNRCFELISTRVVNNDYD